MTIETKTTIQLSDITGIEFECKNCHSVTSWPIAVAHNPLTRCHCGADQWMPHGSALYAAITDLITLDKTAEHQQRAI
jgi:hypothetical protein